MNKLDVMLLRMIKNSKGQFAAVTTIIVAGISVFIALHLSAVNLENTVNEYYDISNFADLYVVLEHVPPQKVKDLERIDGVALAEGRIVLEAPVVTTDAKDRVNIRLISSKGAETPINTCFLLEGKWLSPNSREAMLLDQFAVARGLGQGDRLRVQHGGASYALDITGVTANPEFVYLLEDEQSFLTDPEKFGIVFISEALAKQMSGISGFNEVLITTAPGADEDAIIRSLETQLANYGLRQIIKQKDQASSAIVQLEVESLQRMSAAVPVMFLSVAGLVLLMLLGRMVKRDRVKIGVLKALGYTNRNILLHYAKYAVAAGFVGGLIGSLLGMMSAGGLTRVFLMYFNIPLLRAEFDPALVVWMVAATCVFCALSGLVGARGVLKIAPADSMKSEAPKAGKRVLLERATPLWRRLSFSQKLTVKSVFRNKKRAGFVMAGIAMTYALMLFTTSMPSTMDDMMSTHYAEFQKMDYMIAFRSPVKQSAVNDLRHVVKASHMEGKLEYPFEFEHGNRAQVVSVIGLQSDTIFYGFKDLNGNAVALPKSGALISENMANRLRLSAGDAVKINSFIPGRNSVTIEIAEVVKQTLGSNAYMDIGYMGETLMERHIVNGVYLNADDEQLYERLADVPGVASVMSNEDARNIFEEYMGMMNAMIGFMVVFSGILGFCVVYNATIIIIGEREAEFSALRVLGFGNNDIFRMIVNENNMLLAAGILAGIPLGMSMLSSMSAMVSTDIYLFELTANVQAMAAAAGFTALFVLFAQAAAYQKIKKLDLMSALKNRMA